MKIGVIHILRGHFATLWVDSSARGRVEDFVVFIGVPACMGIGSLFCNVTVSKEFYNLSITFFGIFIALLLNIQVAIFGLFQRAWSSAADDMLRSQQMDKKEQRRLLLGQVNVNVSYLIVLSCVCLVVNIALFVFEANNLAARATSTFLYVHFMLTLLMIVKRTHALFQKEYDIP